MKFKESKSIYLQIADRIMDEILRMVYPEEGRVPSVREYAAMVEVNANTVVRSYDYLQGQEIILQQVVESVIFVSPGSPVMRICPGPPSSVFFCRTNCPTCSGRFICWVFRWRRFAAM